MNIEIYVVGIIFAILLGFISYLYFNREEVKEKVRFLLPAIILDI